MKRRYNSLTKEAIGFYKSLPDFSVVKKRILYQEKGIVCVLEPELFRFNNEDSVSFWFNCKLFLNLDAENNRVENWDDSVAKLHAVLVERWSFLWGQPNFQYRIDGEKSAASIAADMVEMSENYFIPFCRSLHGAASLLRWLDDFQKVRNTQKYNFNIAVGLALMGDAMRSKAYFEKSDGDKLLLKQIAANYNIALSE